MKSFNKTLELKDAKEHKVYMTEKYMKVFQETLHKNIVVTKLKW